MGTDQQNTRESIDPWSFCRHRQTIADRAWVAEMHRLRTRLAPSFNTSIDYALTGRHDENGVPIIDLTVTSEQPLLLMCQRCLEEIAIPIALQVPLGVAKTVEQMTQLPTAYEPLLGQPFNCITLVEDELLLAIPQEPKHALISQCGELVTHLSHAEQSTTTEPSRRPFAGLSDLLKD